MKTEKKRENKFFVAMLISGTIISLMIAGYAFIMLRVISFPQNSPVSPGTFGDMFGSLTALFSGLAFAGLIGTLLMQREELKLQRQELEATREEMKNQREEMTRQAEAQSKNVEIQRLSSIVQIYATYLDNTGKLDGMTQNWIQATTRKEMQEVLKKLLSLDPDKSPKNENQGSADSPE